MKDPQMYMAVCDAGELGNGLIKKRGTGTQYRSQSAANRAIERYKGPEKLKIVPAGPITQDPEFPDAGLMSQKKHGGARTKPGVQMPSGLKAVTVTTTIDPVDLATLKNFGNEKIAVGIRRAAALIRELEKNHSELLCNLELHV